MDKNSNQIDLIICQKNIKYITVNMLNMNLKFINLSANKLQYLPDEITDLKQLVFLKIDRNIIKYLPEQIGKLVNLKFLNVGFNEL